MTPVPVPPAPDGPPQPARALAKYRVHLVSGSTETIILPQDEGQRLIKKVTENLMNGGKEAAYVAADNFALGGIVGIVRFDSPAD